MRMFLCELRLLVKSKIMFLCTAMLLAVMITNLNIKEVYDLEYLRNMKKTSLTMLLASANNGAVAAGGIFAMVTVFSLSRDKRKQGKCLIQACSDYINVVLSRVAAIVCYAIGTVQLGILVVYIVESFGYKVRYNAIENIYTYNMIVLATAIFSILMCSGMYMMLESIYVSIIGFAVLFLIGTTSHNYLFLWVKSNADMYSDFAGIEAVAKYINYNRFLWLGISLTIFCAGMLCIKKYDFEFIRSIKEDKRKRIVLFIIPVLIITSCCIYYDEPYVIKKKVVNYLNNGGKMNTAIHLLAVTAKTRFYTKSGEIGVHAKYVFAKRNSINYIDFKANPGLKLKNLRVNGKKYKINSRLSDEIKENGKVRVKLPKGEKASIIIDYSGIVKDFSGNATSCINPKGIYLQEGFLWLFEPLSSEKGKIKYDLTYIAPQNLSVVSIGKLERVRRDGDIKKWRYRAESGEFCPGVFAGVYRVKNFKAGTAKVKLFYSKKHESGVKRLKTEKLVKAIVNYYENTIGKYPFTKYPLSIVESPVYKSGGHSTLNVVTVCESGFNQYGNTDYYYSDYKLKLSPNDLSTLAHEISHQWWGGAVESETEFPFSNEGFATYYAYKFMKRYSKEGARMDYEEWERTVKSIEKERESGKDFRLLYTIVPYRLVEFEKRRGEKEVLETLSEIYRKHRFGNLKYGEFLDAFNLDRRKLYK